MEAAVPSVGFRVEGGAPMRKAVPFEAWAPAFAGERMRKAVPFEAWAPAFAGERPRLPRRNIRAAIARS